ncbi:MAG: ATP-binding protein [Ignavibacteriales bacterium]|nr:ATP-binding protein [Ignavibacteriales bacterium]
MTRTYNISISNRIEETPRVTALIENEVFRAGFPQKDVYDILIAVDEILSNIVYYAYGEGGDGRIDVAFLIDDGKVELEFSDEGVEFDPLKKKDPDTSVPVDKREIGGLGIFLVKKLMNSVEYSRVGQKNNLKITKIKTGE